MPRRSQGFTLLELMVVLGVVAILAGIAIPLYNKYAHSASMSIANHHYHEAVKVAKATQFQHATALAIGSVSSAPTTSAGWITVFGSNDSAPGGGPAYVAAAMGDPVTGAVGVAALAATSVAITRPAYLELIPYQAIVADGKVTEAAL